MANLKFPGHYSGLSGTKHIFTFLLMQMCCMFERTHEKGNRLCVLHCAWFARAVLLAGITKTAPGKACNKYKTLGQLGLVCVLMLRHKCNF